MKSTFVANSFQSVRNCIFKNVIKITQLFDDFPLKVLGEGAEGTSLERETELLFTFCSTLLILLGMCQDYQLMLGTSAPQQIV